MEKTRIALVGLNFGRHIVDQIRTGPGRDYFEIAAVCDLDRAKADRVAQQIGCRASGNLDDLLAASDLPAIGLFTGPVGRAELIGQIIRAGKDVMTTKPFERDPDRARAVLEEARRLGRVVHLNSPAPVLPPDLHQIQEWRAQYALGRAIGCRMDVWASYREKPDGSWYDDPQKCPAPPLFRLGIYLMNDLVRLLGPARQVMLLQSRLFTGRPTVDNAQLGIRFDSGALANIYASFCVKDGDQYRNSMVLNFENGTIYRNCGARRTPAPGQSAELGLVMMDGNQRQLVAETTVPGLSGDYQWDVFHRAIQGEPPAQEVTIDEIVAGLRIVQAMAEAARGDGMAMVRR